MHAPLRTLVPALTVLLMTLTVHPTCAQDTTSTDMTPADTATTTPTIVETLRETEGFTTLLKALDAAGLTDTLRTDGPYTLFAPTDQAFRTLPRGALKNLLKPANEPELRAILTFHVVPGALTAGDVSARTELSTLHGSKIGVTAADGPVTLTGESKASLTGTNLEASNGVIHVIDAVLLPPVKTALRKQR
jgi:uncharacterized surface protein with fasciclin (FAS1) repeats